MFDKVVKSTVPGQVIEQIKELLVKGELKRGDRLPPERQLADMLGVSRPSLREALRALEYAGMLETRVGEGIFVADGKDAAACPQRTVSGGTGHAGIQCDLIELVPVSLFQVVIQRIKAFFAPADWLGRSVFFLHIISAL